MPFKLPRSFYWILFVVLIVANVNVYRAIFAPRVLTVTVLVVGPADKQSRATLVRSPSGETLLIDTGPDASILRALGESLLVWRRDIDAIILTSSAAGRADGLSAIEDRYNISKIIRAGDKNIPYGISFTFDGSQIEIISPGTFTIYSGSSVFTISSSTPAGVYSFN